MIYMETKIPYMETFLGWGDGLFWFEFWLVEFLVDEMNGPFLNRLVSGRSLYKGFTIL